MIDLASLSQVWIQTAWSMHTLGISPRVRQTPLSDSSYIERLVDILYIPGQLSRQHRIVEMIHSTILPRSWLEPP